MKFRGNTKAVIVSLATALSVDARVVFFCLLLSGDVELNPGPGLFPGIYIAIINGPY